MTKTEREVFVKVIKADLAGRYYRAESSGERATLASLYRIGLLSRRAWRGEEGEADAAHEYVLNAMHIELRPEDATLPIVQEVLESKDTAPEVIHTVLDHQYGKKRAAYDMSDKEANNRLVAEGYKIIHGNSFSKAAWENIRSSGAALPSGQIRPTPKPYSTDPDAPLRELLPIEEWTDDMRTACMYTQLVAKRLLGHGVTFTIDKGRMNGSAACYGNQEITFSLAMLGKSFFATRSSQALVEYNSLLLHEFAHDMEENHLDQNFYKELQRLGAELAQMALETPQPFLAMLGKNSPLNT